MSPAGTFLRVRLEGLSGWRRDSLDPGRLLARLADHDARLASGGPAVLKDQRKSAVTRHGDVVVKESRARGFVARGKRLLAPWRVKDGWRNARRLEARGVPTAPALAWVRRGRRIFTLYEDLSHLPRLDDEVRRTWRGAPRAAQTTLRDATADWLADLHARGVYHGDMKSLHVLVGGRGGEARFVLLDTDRCRVGRGRVSLRRRLKNLAQLAASVPVVVTRTERLRWYRRYAERLGARDDERAVATRAARLLAKKTLVVDAPLE